MAAAAGAGEEKGKEMAEAAPQGGDELATVRQELREANERLEMVEAEAFAEDINSGIEPVETEPITDDVDENFESVQI